jgi:uncharacterized protein (DUF305 family)
MTVTISAAGPPFGSPLPRRCAPVAAAVALLLALAVMAGVLPAQSATNAPHDYKKADVAFVQGMILHHAQAVTMSDWAATHGARPNLLILCKRIALSQRDEITVMQRWLQDRHLAVPDPLGMLGNGHGQTHPPMHSMNGMSMPGMAMADTSMTMPGMLTPAEMRQLDAAHDSAFDRLYLTGMIRHHQGALDMVAALFATPGAGQQSEVSAFAIDVDAGQRAEMGRMQAMLNTLNESPTR